MMQPGIATLYRNCNFSKSRSQSFDCFCVFYAFDFALLRLTLLVYPTDK